LSSNYNKYPIIQVKGREGHLFRGWDAIVNRLNRELSMIPGRKKIVVVECYQGVDDAEVFGALSAGLRPDATFLSSQAFLAEDRIRELTWPDVTDDRIFGRMTSLDMEDFLDPGKIGAMRAEIHQVEAGLILLYGPGASVIVPGNPATSDGKAMLNNPEASVIVHDNLTAGYAKVTGVSAGVSAINPYPVLMIYADMARWEIQLRMRRNEVSNLGISNLDENIEGKYKRGYFVDWRVCDRLKREVMPESHFILDTNRKNVPGMIPTETFFEGLRQAVNRPFSVVPYFDAGPWGGQWMKEICDLPDDLPNYAWCFNCVPEENSLCLTFGGERFETPAINLVFFQPEKLLGDFVKQRFGDEFPIRFDFLDTMGGGNLSLQVHPLAGYIREQFGIHYTQDESYYLVEAGEGAKVYLGLKEGVDPGQMISDLKAAESGESGFDDNKHVQQWPARKHDHFLIPGGTVHCSGKDCMVLEISATPYIFTFKLWDWGRLGLDGKPRPINIGHGARNIQWNRTESWVKTNLVNRFERIATGDGWYEEKTGLHELEFIETRRHCFTKKVTHHTLGGVNVLCLVEGREIAVESPSGSFEPFVVHFAETFIVPAGVGEYTIRPYGESEGKECITIKAYIRNEQLTMNN